MSQTLNLKIKGKYTNPNPLALDDGALLEALNCVIDRENTVEQRRGYERYGTTVSNMKRLFNYKSTLLLHHGSKLAYDSDSAGTWVDYAGSFAPPAGAVRIREAEANRNFYFLTSAGVMKLDAILNPVVQAGMVKALDGTGALAGSGSGWMTANTQVAYRVVWGITDANNNKIIGSPSQRILVANSTGGSDNVVLTFSIPAGITVSHFYQVYRSAMSVSATAEPNDELQLIVEKSPTAGEIVAGVVAYTDLTPETLRGASLYTNPSQQGILQSNEQPPLARDIVAYKQMMLYANTVSKQRLNITLISVGASSGIQVNDTLTIAGVVYTGKGAENTAAGEFEVVTGGTPASNIDSTSKSIIRCINRYASNTLVYAYYMSGYNDLPGKILIEERGIGGAQFVATSSRGGAFNPVIPAAGTSYGSANDTSKNRVYISKPGQPESVPLLQYIDCGSANKNVFRIVSLRDSFFVLKEDGVYRGTGEDPTTIRINLFDNTTELLAIDSAVPFNNQVYGYTTQGITAISDSGVQIISRPIEQDLLRVSAEQFTNFISASFGMSYESDRKYMFATVSDELDSTSTQQEVYNSLTNAFTTWGLNMNHAIVFDKDNKIYFCNADPAIPYVMRERKSFTDFDYADDQIQVVILSQSGLSIEVVDSSLVTVGWTLSDGTRKSIVTGIPDETHITVKDYLTWAVGTPSNVYKPIYCKVKWIPQHGGNTAMLKHFTDVLSHFRNATFDELTFTYSSDVSGYDESKTMQPNTSGSWGTFPWGYPSWGGRDIYLQTLRTMVPLEKAKSRWLNFQVECDQALANFSIAGLAMKYEEVSLRSK